MEKLMSQILWMELVFPSMSKVLNFDSVCVCVCWCVLVLDNVCIHVLPTNDIICWGYIVLVIPFCSVEGELKSLSCSLLHHN